MLLVASVAARPLGEGRLVVGEELSIAVGPDDRHPVASGSAVALTYRADAEEPVTIGVASDDANPMVWVLDQSGAVLAHDDDGGLVRDARVVVPVGADETVLVVAALDRLMNGELRVTLERGEVPLPTGTAYVVARAERYAALADAAQARGFDRHEVPSRFEAGNAFFNLKAYDRARKQLQRLLEIGEAGGLTSSNIATISILLGASMAGVGDLAGAESLIVSTLESHGTALSPPVRLLALSTLASIRHEQARLPEALSLIDDTLVLVERAGMPAAQRTQLLIERANIEAELGELARAASTVEEARRQADALADDELRARVALTFGRVQIASGRPRDARRTLQAARGLTSTTARLLDIEGELGTAALACGEYTRARTHFLRVLSGAEEADHRLIAARAQASLGFVAFNLGDIDRAIGLFETALAAMGPDGSPKAVAETHVSLGLAHLGQVRRIDAGAAVADRATSLDAARAALDRAADIAGDAGHEAVGVLAALGRAFVELRSGDLESAEEAARHTERRVIGGHWPRHEIMTQLLLSELARRRGRLDEALRRAEQANARAREVDDWPALFQSLAVATEARLAAGDGDAALATVQEAQSLVTRPDFELATDDEVMRFRSLPRYADLAELGQDAVALELRSTEGAARQAVTRRGFELSSFWKGFVLLGDLVDRTSAELPADLLAAASSALGASTTLVEYVEGRTRLFAYVLRDGRLEFHDLCAKAELVELLDEHQRAVSDPRESAGPAVIARTGRALHARLMGQLVDGAAGQDGPLVVVPSPMLAELSFETLVVGGPETPRSFDDVTFVVDRRTVAYAPSVPVFTVLSTEPVGPLDDVLVVADPVPADDSWPRLPGSRDEARAIERIARGLPQGEVDVELLLGEAATREALFERSRGRAVMHIGAHGDVAGGDPRDSALVLSAGARDDGRLTLADVLELDLDAELVVLAACESGRGEVVAGEGVHSLARAFLSAGARSVLVSLWPVGDEAARATMTHLYDGLFARGWSVARAARLARLAVRRGEVDLAKLATEVERGRRPAGDRPARRRGGVHPHDWAPFIVIGPP